MSPFSTISAIGSLALAVSTLAAPPSKPSPICKCLSSGPSCFPPTRTLDAFNKTIEGRLAKISPPAIVCYQGPEFDAAACEALRANATNPYFWGEHIGATMYPKTLGGEFGVNVCPASLNSSLPDSACGQGKVSSFGVDARTVEHVRKTVKFAAAHNLRLTVKSTGHDQAGRSSAKGSFLLWLHHLRGIEFVDTFIPESCTARAGLPAVTVSAGEQWGTLYEQAEARGLAVVGGAVQTVGVIGGYLQGGGHSPLSRTYGMASDQVLEFKVVTADGQLRTANSCTNQDIFFALRGGGVGYGVVTSATIRTYPSPKTALALYTIEANAGNITKNAALLRQKFVDSQPEWDKIGLSGYIGFGSTTLWLALFQPNGSNATIAAALKPLFDFADPARFAVAGVSFGSPTFYSAYRMFKCYLNKGLCTDTVGENGALGSRLIPTKLFQNQKGRDKVGAALSSILDMGTNFLVVHFIAGGQVSNFPPDATGLNPAWRQALWHVVTANFWADDANAAQILQKRRATTAQTKVLAKLSSHAYINEADEAEADWQNAFYGTHYKYLLRIKNKYDPAGLFVCHQCVGSERWSADGNCRV
ncbi:uncharacterized protein EV422DRAFT_115583 [Fimicolochytrium jonesii]|uniref:uncharacterized protein n=1 Tax=Fimicolochytrium jonesii TaxID=1396493 RepID=UPI0022FF2A7B|nr:uncharacterized protein EV422DRAFT_115583 [Fimicolochytrium jonesii]KAI8819507.1 hypothetical protein EV422DRAFT_115583 [Fimicolochytrium jonesii]